MDNLLVIGCGGIGSWFIDSLCRQFLTAQISLGTVAIADGDIVESSQLEYQNFTNLQIGSNKAIVLSERYEAFGIVPIDSYIAEESILDDYDLFILCVDNEPIRKLLCNYCFSNNRNFLDLRATGRKIMVLPKMTLEENLKFITDDTTHYSCQEPIDKEKNTFQNGNHVAAEIGIQMLLNIQRGLKNRPVTLLI